MFFDRRRKLDRLNTLIDKMSARFLTLLIFAIGWTVCGGHKSVMPVLLSSMLNISSARTVLGCTLW